MHSQPKFNKLLLVLGVVLLLGASAVGLRHLSNQSLVRLNKPRQGQVAGQQGHPQSVSESGESRAGIRAGAQRATLADEKQAQEQSADLSLQSPSHLATIKVADTAAERIEPAPMLPAARLEERERAGIKDRGPRPDHPDEAVRFRRLQMQDENGFIPPDGLEKARQHMKLMKAAREERIKARQQGAQESALEPQGAGIEPDSWDWLGPGNIGGRIRSIVIHPTNTNTMFVGSVSGGIWRTDNGGVFWLPVNDFLANLAVSTMVINPANPDIMYAGTGEGLYGAVGRGSFIDAVQGEGVFRSTDRGLTWNQLASTDDPLTGNWFYVNRLSISPNGNTILAATNSGIWESTDGGTMWTQRTFTRRAFDIDFQPGDSRRAIVGELGSANGSIGSALYSTDGGQTWTPAAFNPAISGGRVELAYAPSNPSIVYASVDQNNGIYRSTNGGQIYTQVYTGSNLLAGQGGYDNIIWVNPQDPSFVIVGGILLYRSTDGGTTFTPIGDTSVNLPHADQHMIVAHPGFNNTTNRTVFFGNDGGIFRLADVAVASPATSGWSSLNHNLGITQFYGAAGNPKTYVIVGGTQDNGTVTFNGGTESWTTMLGGDGGFCAADPTDSNYFYGEYINLEIFRSSNGGKENSGSYIYCDPAQINPTGSVCNSSNGIRDAGSNGANFIAPFILDPNDADTMLAGGLSLWRSTDVKTAAIPTWKAIKAPTADSSPISAIAVHPSTSSFIYVGHNNGDIFYTTGGTLPTPPWTKIDTAALPNRFVTRLVIDNTRSPNWIYATFGGFRGDNVYRTTDFGATWTDVTGAGATGLPDVPVRTLVFHPHIPNLLYVGTEMGVFTSEDAGATWSLPQDGPANVSVDELFWLGEDLIAATHGRGLYRASGGSYVDCNYTGFGRGTFDQPFKTITAAVNAATTYQKTIWIKPCNYNEPMTIKKRVELRSLRGTVTIGRN